MIKRYIIDKNVNSSKVCEPTTSWGGNWTEQKLDAFEKYVNAYLTIMNANRDRYGWKLIYFDGFAGSGSREEDNKNRSDVSSLKLFEELEVTTDELTPYQGAAERVLTIEQKGFDYYYFIDINTSSSNRLKEKLAPLQNNRIFEFRDSDANNEVKKLARALHRDIKLKSLVFLDPFGMQVNWDAIQQLENTKTDLWILIPTGVIVNRLLDRKGKLTHIEKLTSFFGKDEAFLRSYFYNTIQENTLFGETEIIEKVKEPIKKIAELYIQQMQTIFKYVTEQPLVLYNSRNVPIFHFACASNNQSAVKIAHQIINK